MRRGCAGMLLAAALALAGCKAFDQKDDKTSGLTTGQGKSKDAKNKDAKTKDAKGDKAAAKGQHWLDGTKPGNTAVKPPGGTLPPDPGAAATAQDALGGRVLDPNGKPARNVTLRIESIPADAKAAVETEIQTNNEGHFVIRGLKPGKTYEVTALARQDGKPLIGVVQTKVPNVILTILLREDVSPAGGVPPADGTFPPLPQPVDKVSDGFPPGGAAPLPVVPPAAVPPKQPVDGAWSPGGSGTGGVPPATIGAPGGSAPKPPDALPPPDDLSYPPVKPLPVKPENTAGGPRPPFTPPPTSIPGPGSGGPAPIPPGGRSSGTGAAGAGKLVLLDTLERPWSLDTVPTGSLVLVEFISSTCAHCPKFIPALRDLQARYAASGLQVAAVLCDDLPQKDRAALASKYARTHNLNYAVYVEPGKAGSVRDSFGVESYPTAVLLDTSGRVLWKGHPGEKTKLEAAIKQHLGK